MIKLLNFSLLIIILSCSAEKEVIEKPIIISGTIENSDEESLYISGINANDEAPIASDGTFGDTISSGSGFYTLYYGRDKVNVYLNNGDHLKINTNGPTFSSSASFVGGGAEIAEYFKKKSILIDTLKGSNGDFYGMDESAFGKKALALKGQLLSNLKKEPSLSKIFVEQEQKDINFGYLAHLSNFEGAHEYYADEEGFKASGDFNKIIEKVDLDNEIDYTTIPSYKELISTLYSNKMYGEETLVTMEEILNMKSSSIKSSLGKSIAYNISPGNEDNQKLVDGVKKLVTDEEYLEKLEKKYSKIQKLVAGSPSPTFKDYENHAGGTKSLEDYNGKYVYIDVWATWCGPCIGEIPHLKEVEKKYHGKNVEFVSISIDKKKDRDKWIGMIDNKELGGSQLMADNAWKSAFVEDYVIDGIPRFILLDPDGNIVSGDAPRPSDEKLIEIFTENGI